jgi:Na+/melibiose symporter-like transporter
VPIVVLALVAGRFLVPTSRDPEQARLDPVGALLSTVGIVALVYGLIEAPTAGWGSGPTVAAFLLAGTVLTAFVLWERRVDEPMLDMDYFRNPAFSTGTGGMILVFLAMYGVMFLITQYFQLVLGYSPLSAALRVLPMAPIMIVVAPLTPRLSLRFGANRTVAFGLALVAVGLLAFRGLGLHTPYLYVLVCLFLLISGIALAMSPMTASIMSAVPPRRAGAGSATNDATRELGAALGIAVLGSVAASRYRSQLTRLLGGLSTPARQTASSSLAGALHTAAGLPPAAGRALTLGADRAFVDGIHLAVTAGAVLAAASAVIVWRKLPHHVTHDHGALHGTVEALEEVAELGLAGVPPLFGDPRPEPASQQVP